LAASTALKDYINANLDAFSKVPPLTINTWKIPKNWVVWDATTQDAPSVQIMYFSWGNFTNLTWSEITGKSFIVT
jgi:aminopeptidase-like protein